MDVIFDTDLVHTAQILELNRLSIIRLKYDRIINFDRDRSKIPSATIERVFDCRREEKYCADYQVILSKLANSPLIRHALAQAPELVKLESELEIEQLNIQQDNIDIFDLNLLKSILFIPLFIKKETSKYQPVILGYLILQKYHPKIWQIAEIETFKWIGKQVSTAILSQQTLAKVQSLVDERTSQLKTSLDVQAKLSNKLLYHLDELRRLNKIKDNFIASLSDALKTPLSNLKIGIKMLNMVNKNESLKKYINILDDECEKEINLVNNLLKLQQLQSNSLEIQQQKIDLQPCLEELYNNFSQELHHRNINFKINCELEFFYTDLNSINSILQELTKNAAKFSVSDSTINLSIYRESNCDYIEISNLGIEINSEDQANIFQPFYQSSKIENVTNSGTGLGLALVKCLVEHLRGTIRVSSVLCSESGHYLNTFSLAFPQNLHEVSST